ESNDDLEALPEPLRTETGTHLSSIQEGQVVCNEELDWAIRLALREVIWCRLEDANGNYIHFGHDYYMYAGSTSKHVATPSLPDGMFADIFASPYHRDFDCSTIVAGRGSRPEADASAAREPGQIAVLAVPAPLRRSLISGFARDVVPRAHLAKVRNLRI